MKLNKTEKIFGYRVIKSANKYIYTAGNFTYQVSTPYPSKEIIKTCNIAYKEARISLSTVKFMSNYGLFLAYKVYNNLILLIRRNKQSNTFYSINIV